MTDIRAVIDAIGTVVFVVFIAWILLVLMGAGRKK